jgi:glycogen debranching enzyme
LYPLNIAQEVENKTIYLDKIFKQSELPLTDSFKFLQRAADQFIVYRKPIDGYTIIAGYHWFSDWGRDTMIALPGCTLTTKRFEIAKNIIETFSKYLHNGIIPNRFPDNSQDKPKYNTIDASLWLFNTLYSYILQSKNQVDWGFVRRQYCILSEILKHYIYGRYSGQAFIDNNRLLQGIIQIGQTQLPVGDGNDGIGMEPDGLIKADNGQLTWMDAAKNEFTPYTPREGKAIEINALWYNALRIMQELSIQFNEFEQAEQYKNLGNLVQKSMMKFWNPYTGCLFDLIDVQRPPYITDGSIRPNQLFALSLPYRPFYNKPEIEKSVLEVVTKKLLTPYGLKTLPSDHPEYSPYYPNESPFVRDKVYHQGTVWAWLIGSYADAYMNIYDGSQKQTRQEVYKIIQPLLNHLKGNIKPHWESGSCIGGIAEIFDAKEPHYSKGAVNQAWSVAEVLRILAKIQDIVQEAESQ